MTRRVVASAESLVGWGPLRGTGRLAASLAGFFRHKPLGAAGGAVLFMMVVIALAAPFFATHDPDEMNAESKWAPPSPQFIMGADELGRDVWSRIVFGARVSLVVGLASTLLGTALGALLGLVGGYRGGAVDNAIQRVMDILMAFPTLVLALALMAALGSSLQNVVIAIGVVMIPRAARVIRSAALAVKENQYIEAARAIGCSDWRIIFRHVMPNCVAAYLIIVTAQLGAAIVVEASLSFLGMGVPPPHATWGRMLTKAVSAFQSSPWVAVFPGLAISLAVFGFNLLGDAVRDTMDPRLRSR